MTDFHSDDRIHWHPGEVQRTICELLANGIGTKALHQVVGYCTGRGIRTLHLEVDHSNPRVRRLYEREGLQECGFYILSKWITPPIPDNG